MVKSQHGGTIMMSMQQQMCEYGIKDSRRRRKASPPIRDTEPTPHNTTNAKLANVDAVIRHRRYSGAVAPAMSRRHEVDNSDQKLSHVSMFVNKARKAWSP